MKIVCAYLIGGLLSYYLIAGWCFADHQAQHYSFRNQEISDASFCILWPVGAAIAWPVFLPGTWIALSYNGWQNPWIVRFAEDRKELAK